MNNRIVTKGFTLIELLVVIAIIGILASIVLVSLNSARNKGKDARIISNVNQIRTQIESEAVSGRYIATTDSCLAQAPNTLNAGSANCTALSADLVANNSALTLFTGGEAPASCTTDCSSYSSYALYAAFNTGSGYCVDNTGKTSTTVPTGPGC